jgi:DNA-binding response OmpR family regulator
MSERKILVVEGDCEIRQLIVSAAGERCEVDTANSYAEAGRALGAAEYQVVIIDADLPDADGLALGKLARGRGSMVIVVPRKSDHFLSSAPRGFYILARPIAPHRLLELIDRTFTRNPFNTAPP